MSSAWTTLYQKSREYKISKIKEGDLIRLRSEVLSFVSHVGIVFQETDGLYVYHNTPDLLNRSGGSVIRESLADWLKSREILSVEPTGLASDEIHKIAKEVHGTKYDLLHFNCEHFTSYIKSKRKISPQVAKWAIIVATLSITYLIVRKK